MKDSDILKAITPVIKAFEKLSVAYYIGGSVASSAYGLARATLDVDIITALSNHNVNNLVTLLEQAYYIDKDMIIDAINTRSSFNLIHFETMIKIDIFIIGEIDYDQSAFKRIRQESIDIDNNAHKVYLASAEDVILSKLDWFRKGKEISENQWHDILGVMKVQKDLLDMDYLQHWADKLNLKKLLDKAFIQAGIIQKK